MMPKAPMIALLTDFGRADHWVGSLKAALLGIQPDFKIIDVSHEIARHDVVGGAFALYRSYRDFPPWTVHLAIVDPGVGGPRRPIIVTTDDRWFIGPDNGIFSYIYERDYVSRVIHVTADHYFKKPVSETFHARDVFAPIAGWLTQGIDSTKFGDVIEDFTRLQVPLDRIVGDSLIKGEVCAVDRYGNLVTNIRSATIQTLAEKTGKNKFKLLISGHEMPIVQGGYNQPLQIFGVIGSSDLVEISCNQRSAADVLGITASGKEVGIMGD